MHPRVVAIFQRQLQHWHVGLGKDRGEVIGPSDAGYDAARKIWNEMVDKRPALIVRCNGVADVIQSRVGILAEKGDPLGQMKLSSRARAQAVHRDATALLTACGLALRSFD